MREYLFGSHCPSQGCVILSQSTHVKTHLPKQVPTDVSAVANSLPCPCPSFPSCTSVTLSASCPQSLPPALRPSSCPQGSHSSTCSCFWGASLPTKLVRPEVWHGHRVYQPQPSPGSARTWHGLTLHRRPLACSPAQ